MSNEVTNFFLDLPRDKINIFSRMDVWMEDANFFKKLKLLPLMGQKNKKKIKNVFLIILNVLNNKKIK